jgi:hypothetical protein
MVIVDAVIALVLTIVICNVINKNTIGTTGAYAKRAIIVWIVCFIALGALIGY